MATNYLGEILMVGFNFAPNGYALCNGQTMSISQNSALFSLLGTTYGGDGVTTFQLPNLQGRVPIHSGQGAGLSPYVLGQQSGTENVTLITSQLPSHNHTLQVNDNTTGIAATGAAGFLNSKTESGESVAASTLSSPAILSGSAITLSGGNQPHNNLQPSLCINFVIALQGIFPSRN